MPAKIISAFPGCGKSTYYRKWSQYSPDNVWRSKNDGNQVYQRFNPTIPVGEKILDCDSSLFNWIYDSNGNKTDTRNPDFPNNYIQYIKERREFEDIIFISSHMSVRNALRENSIKYTLIYPEKDSKDFWLQRFQKRGDSPQFINKLLMNWDTFIDEMEQETFPEKFILRFDDVIDVALMNHIMSYDEK